MNKFVLIFVGKILRIVLKRTRVVLIIIIVRYEGKGDFMGRGNNSSRSKRNTQNHGMTIIPPAPAIDYEQIRLAIIDANKTIREEEKIANRKVLEGDHLTKLLVELLNGLFTFVMVILVVCGIASVVFSFVEASESDANIRNCASCWLFFAVGLLILLLVRRLKRQGKITRKFWFSFMVCITCMLITGPFIVSLFFNQLLCVIMSLVVVIMIMCWFCYLAMQSLKRENDRMYLVSYFAAITGIAALVVSVITLIVAIFQNG